MSEECHLQPTTTYDVTKSLLVWSSQGTYEITTEITYITVHFLHPALIFCQYWWQNNEYVIDVLHCKPSQPRVSYEDTSIQGVAASFVPWRVRPHIDSTSELNPTAHVPQLTWSLLKFICLLPKKGNIVRTMKQNHTKHVYFSVFCPLRVTGGLEKESLGRVYWGELGGGELSGGELANCAKLVSFI